METLSELLDRTAARSGNSVFLVHEEKVWTFKKLQREVLKAAALFSQSGVQRQDRVALLMRNCPEFVICYLGLARIGAVAVPINFMIQKPQEIHYMLKDSGAVAAVTQKEFLQNLLSARDLSEGLPALKKIWSVDSTENRPEVSAFWPSLNPLTPLDIPEPLASPEDAAAILYTSGTTGFPKGAMLTHGNLTSNTEACCLGLELLPRDVFLCILPMFHSFAWTACVLVPIQAGAKVVVVSAVAPPKPWLKLMARHKVSIFPAIPPVFNLLSKEAKGFKRLVLKYWFFRTVRVAISGSAPLSPAVLKAFESKLGVPILEGYGLTETSPAVSINRLHAKKIGSVGQLLPGIEAKVVDENEKSLPLGAEGEICIRGPNVMKGYLNQPEATRQAFTEDGWFKTGDIGVADEDGYLYIRDRKKDMIIVKGLKVFPAQVESVILGHPSVKEAAVVGIPDSSGDETIKLYVTLKTGGSVEKSEIMQFCREKLDPYKRPRDIEILEEMPKNALQKILKRVLRQQEIEKHKLSPANSTLNL